MRPEELFLALGSSTRIEILKILAAGPRNTAQVLDELDRRGFRVKYRESVFRALERLVSVGLVEKYYDNSRRGIHYRLLKVRLEIDFQTGQVG